MLYLSNKPKHTPTLAEQYSQFIPVQVTHSTSLQPQATLQVLKFRQMAYTFTLSVEASGVVSDS